MRYEVVRTYVIEFVFVPWKTESAAGLITSKLIRTWKGQTGHSEDRPF